MPGILHWIIILLGNKGLQGSVEHRGTLPLATHQVVVSIMAGGVHEAAAQLVHHLHMCAGTKALSSADWPTCREFEGRGIAGTPDYYAFERKLDLEKPQNCL